MHESFVADSENLAYFACEFRSGNFAVLYDGVSAYAGSYAFVEFNRDGVRKIGFQFGYRVFHYLVESGPRSHQVRANEYRNIFAVIPPYNVAHEIYDGDLHSAFRVCDSVIVLSHTL